MLPYLFIYFTNLSFSANCFTTFFFSFFGELVLYYCIQAFSNCEEWGYSSLWWEDFSCCKAWVLEHAGFSSCRLSCPSACAILPDQGQNLYPLYQQADSLPLDHREVHFTTFSMYPRLIQLSGFSEFINRALVLCIRSRDREVSLYLIFIFEANNTLDCMLYFEHNSCILFSVSIGK